MVYKTSLHDTTSMTAAQLVLVGHETCLSGDLMVISLETQFQELQNYSLQLQNELLEMIHLIRGWLQIASDKMKMWYDIHSNSVGFEQDQIWLYNPKCHCGHPPKLQTNWEGPYTVKERNNNVVYWI